MVSPDLAVSFFSLMLTPVMSVFVLYVMPGWHNQDLRLHAPEGCLQ